MQKLRLMRSSLQLPVSPRRQKCIHVPVITCGIDMAMKHPPGVLMGAPAFVSPVPSVCMTVAMAP